MFRPCWGSVGGGGQRVGGDLHLTINSNELEVAR